MEIFSENWFFCHKNFFTENFDNRFGSNMAMENTNIIFKSHIDSSKIEENINILVFF